MFTSKFTPATICLTGPVKLPAAMAPSLVSPVRPDPDASGVNAALAPAVKAQSVIPKVGPTQPPGAGAPATGERRTPEVRSRSRMQAAVATSRPGTRPWTGAGELRRPAATVLVATRNAALGPAIERVLTRNGYSVCQAGPGSVTLDLFRDCEPDAVVLDLSTPDGSGIDACRAIRSLSDVPILFVSDRSSEIDIVVALEVGADDYLARPQRFQELVARIRMLLRRAPSPPRATPTTEPLTVGQLVLDLDRHDVTLAGDLLAMPRKEFQLLALLMERPGVVVTRSQCIERVWGADYVGDTKTLDVHIRRLRDKIENDRHQPQRIVTVRGLGFKLEPGA
ncbi:MAG: winged helix-turn-helix domain-containing protein [Acidimicrobiales bacterium]